MPSLGEAIAGVIKKHGWEKAVEKHRAVAFWRQAVGPSLARHCQAVEVRGDTLYVSVKSPAWRNEISFHKEDILQAINQQLEKHLIKDLRFIR